jgi:NADH-quinone oxidoreductase subunit J
MFIFLFMAASALISAILVIATRNIVHSVIALATCFIAIAVLFVMLSAEFVAIVQILVYVGAVVVVILFGIMLTRREIMEGENR